MVLGRLKAQYVVVESEHIALSLIVDDAGMVAARAFGRFHYVPLNLPRAGRTVAHRVANSFGTTGRGESKIVASAALIEPRAFLIMLQLAHFHDVAGGGNHVLVQLDVIQVGVAPVHIGLPVVVDEHRGVYVFPVFLLPYERLSQRVFERTVRRIGHEHAYAVAVQRAVHVELAAALDHMLRPSTVVTLAPSKVFERRHYAVVSPVNHVGRRVQQPVKHLEAVGVVLVVRCVKINGVVVNHRGGVGRVLGLHHRHLRHSLHGKQT